MVYGHDRRFSLIFKAMLLACGLGFLLLLYSHLGEVSPTSSEAQQGEIVKAPRVVLIARVVSVDLQPPGSSLPDKAHVEIEELVEGEQRSNSFGQFPMYEDPGAESAESSRFQSLDLKIGTVLELRALYGLAPVIVEYQPATKGPGSSVADPTTTSGSGLSSSPSGSDPEVHSITTGLVDEVTRFHLPGFGPGDKIRAEISYFGGETGSIGLYEVLRSED